MTSQPVQSGDAALLIDWENLKYSLLNKERRVSISALRDAAEKHGRLVVARAYADWQEHGFDAPNLYASGIEPIYVPVRRSHEEGPNRTKNSVDVKLTADCIELIHRFPSIGTYILVSGDQDFIHVVNTLRPYGKRTILIGVLGTTSVRLAEQVDEMIYYDTEVDPLPDIPGVAGPSVSGEEAGEAGVLANIARQSLNAIGYAEPGPPDVRAVSQLIEAIVEVTGEYRGDGRALVLSQLGLELAKRRRREFMMYGRGRLTPILSTMAAHKLIQLAQRGGVDWIFLSNESVPDETETSQPSSPPWNLRQGFVDEDYASLTEDEKTALVRLIAGLEGTHRFLSFNVLRTALQSSPIGRSVDSTHVLNDLIARRILQEGERKEWFDSTTGQSGTYATFRLAREDAEVAARLSSSGF